MEGLEGTHFELTGPLRGRDPHSIATVFSDQASTDGRGGGDKPLADVGFLAHHQAIFDVSISVEVVEDDLRAEPDSILGDVVKVDEGEVRQSLLELDEARADVVLALFGHNVLGVLAEVAERPGALELVGQVVVELAFESLDLVLKLLGDGVSHNGNRVLVLWLDYTEEPTWEATQVVRSRSVFQPMRIKRASCLALQGLCFLVFTPSGGKGVEERIRHARNIVIETGETVGDALCFFCSIEVRGHVRSDAVAIGGSIGVAGTVDGDVVCSGGAVRLGPAAKVGGEVVAVGGPLVRSAGASVAGGVESSPWIHLPGQREIFWRGTLSNLAVMLAALVIFYLLARPRRLEAMAALARKRFLLVPLSGALGLAIAAGLFVLLNVLMRRALWFSLAGEFLVALLLVLIFGLGATALSYGFGRRLARDAPPLAATLAGAGVVFLSTLVPIAGFVAFTLFGLVALGCAVGSGLGASRNWLAMKTSSRGAPSPNPSP